MKKNKPRNKHQRENKGQQQENQAVGRGVLLLVAVLKEPVGSKVLVLLTSKVRLHSKSEGGGTRAFV